MDTAYSIIRSVLTSAQAGITWGVPVARAERVTDSGGRGSWSLDWREDVGPRENSERPFMREVAKFRPRELSVSAGGENADASGRVACSCSGRVRQEQRYLMSSRDTRQIQELEVPSS